VPAIREYQRTENMGLSDIGRSLKRSIWIPENILQIMFYESDSHIKRIWRWVPQIAWWQSHLPFLHVHEGPEVYSLDIIIYLWPLLTSEGIRQTPFLMFFSYEQCCFLLGSRPYDAVTQLYYTLKMTFFEPVWEVDQQLKQYLFIEICSMM
jgi:hypothetical protein